MNLKQELKKILNEEVEVPYDRETDENKPEVGMKRKKVLTLRDINRLKEIRNKKREELAQNSVFVPYIYGPTEQQENGGMDMGGSLPM